MKHIAAAIIIVGALIVFSGHSEGQVRRFEPNGKCVSLQAIPTKDGHRLCLFRLWEDGLVEQTDSNGNWSTHFDWPDR